MNYIHYTYLKITNKSIINSKKLMKRIFTLALISAIAAFSFAGVPAKKAAKQHTLQTVKVGTFEQKNALEAKAIKAAAAEEISSSVLRHASKPSAAKQINGGEVVASVARPAVVTPVVANAPKTVANGSVEVVKDSYGIITSVTGESKFYTREGTAYFAQSNQVAFAAQTGYAEIIEDGNDVYIKNPVSRYGSGAWIKGTKEGNTIVIPVGQPVMYSDQYEATLSVRWGVITSAGKIQAYDSFADSFVFTIDGDVLTLQNTIAYSSSNTGDAPFMGVMWDDDNSFSGYGDAETVLTFTTDVPTLVTPPAGLATDTWYLNGYQYSEGDLERVKNQTATVGIDGANVYIKGLFKSMPNAWVKGTISGSTVSFDKFTYLGTYGSSEIYFTGVEVSIDGTSATLVAPSAVYDAAAKTITFNEGIVANGSKDEFYYLAWYTEAELSAEMAVIEEPVITNLTAALPYSNTLDTNAEQDQVAVYDANDDGRTFSIASSSNSKENKTPVLRYLYNSSQAGDDYAVFPGLSLKAGVSYKVKVDASAYGSSYPEKFEVVVGTIAKASQLNTVIIEPTQVASAEFTTFAADFVPEADGVYYFAVHAISEPDMYYLFIDNFSVTENNPNAPSAVKDLKATPDANADLKATVTFTVPSTTVGGGVLEGAVMYTIARDGEVLVQVESEAGAEVSYLDESIMECGDVTYSVIVYANEAASDAATVSVYVGEDTPLDPENLTLTDKNTKVGMSWDAVTEGANGGIVKPENVTYNAYPVEMVVFWGMQFPSIDYDNPYATGITGTSYDVEFNSNEGEQTYTYFAVSAENGAGESGGVYNAILTGTPYELPLVETCDGNAVENWWGIDYDDNIYDADGGVGLENDAFVFVAPCAGFCELQSGKIAVSGQNPMVSFDYKSSAAATLKVIAVTANGSTVLKTINVAASSEMTSVSVSLAEYVTEPYTRIFIRGEFTVAANLYIDNFIVMDVYQHNLVASVSAPKSIVAGKNADIKVTVKNEGQDAAEAYTVKIYADEEVIAEFAEEEVEELAFMESAVYTATLKTTIFTEPAEVTIKAEVEYAMELKPADNADEVVLTIAAPAASPIATLTAEQNNNGLEITWTVKSETAAEKTDDFESYEMGIYTDAMGDYTGIDGDEGSSYGWESSEIAWEYTGDQYAFAIMNFPAVFVSGSGVEATSGDQALMFMSVADGFANDDWFISPMLPGCAQTVSFQACPVTIQYGAEIVEVLYSTTTAEKSAFTKVATFNIDEEEWTECSAELPEGAKYFALHYVSNDVFALFIDDLTYTVGGASAEAYNVYIDEALVATVAGEETSYVYGKEIAEGDHKISVSAVIASKETAAYTISVTTAIEAVKADADAEIFNLQGIRVNNADVKSGVYMINGVKTLVK